MFIWLGSTGSNFSFLRDGRTSTRYNNRLHDFSVNIPTSFKNIYVNSIFPRTARVSACRTFSFDLWSINGFSLELRDTFYLQVLCKWTSCMLYSFRTSFFFGTPCLVVTVQPRMEWNPLKKNKKFSQAEWKISEPKSWWINIS